CALPICSHLNIVFREDNIMIDKKIIAHEPPVKEIIVKENEITKLEENGEDYKQISIFEEDDAKK
ncbi:MAG: hypothetical protein PHD98_02925, partial [Bacilli bacterium]|nr:hypothetical protein [Bacilli bacterium]